MRYLYFALAALGCIAAVLLRATTGQPWAPLAALVVAAVFFGLGMWATSRPETDFSEVRLTSSQQQEIERLVAEDKFSTAVRQVQMWHRGMPHDDAARLVRAAGR